MQTLPPSVLSLCCERLCQKSRDVLCNCSVRNRCVFADQFQLELYILCKSSLLLTNKCDVSLFVFTRAPSYHLKDRFILDQFIQKVKKHPNLSHMAFSKSREARPRQTGDARRRQLHRPRRVAQSTAPSYCVALNLLTFRPGSKQPGNLESTRTENFQRRSLSTLPISHTGRRSTP